MGHRGRVIDPADVSLRGTLRALRELFGDRALVAAGTSPPLERIAIRSDPPSVAPGVPLEVPGARQIEVSTDPLVSAFLDGVQRSRVVGYLAGSPLIYASVAAAVRERVARRLETWREPSVRRALFASRGKLGETAWNQLVDSGVTVVDITADVADEAIPVHPFALRARALDLVALEREGLERRLAAEWCRSESRWLWIDGGISGNLAVDERATAFGVVKSHTTLYGSAEQVESVLSLKAEERSPAFLVGHRPRRAVASWYLRLRATAGGERVRLDLNLGDDTDRDGLPDAWEEWQLYIAGRRPGANGWELALISRDGDFDGDGISNFHEYIAGTFAADPSDRFELRLLGKTASAVQLEFFGITGKSYTVEESADLKTWTTVSFALSAQGAEQARYQAPEVGIRSIFVKAPSTTSRFYRLSVR